MMMNVEKNRNFVTFTNVETNKSYAFDINTGILYGLSKKPIASNIPSWETILLNYLRQDIPSALPAYNVCVLLRQALHANYSAKNMSQLHDCLIVADKLQSIGYYLACNPYCIKADELRWLADAKNFKDFVKYIRLPEIKRAIEQNMISLRELVWGINKNKFKEQMQSTFAYWNVPDEIVNALYDNKRYINDKYLDRAVYYLMTGLWDFAMTPTIDDEIELYDRTVFQMLGNYFNLCEVMHVRPEKNDFFHAYGKLKTLYQTQKEKIEKEALMRWYDNQKLAFDFENENFKVIVPTSTEDFKFEAEHQRNCVYRLYLPKVRRHETHVVFIRDKANLDMPWITCEVRDGSIRQFLKKCNSDNLTIEERVFKVEFQKHLNKMWDRD